MIVAAVGIPRSRAGRLRNQGSRRSRRRSRSSPGYSHPTPASATYPYPASRTGPGLKRLRRENAELRRANAILKTASAFFAAELDRPPH